MGVSKSRVGNLCTTTKCTCAQKILIRLKNDRKEATNICQPKPNIERKLVSFTNCWNKKYQIGNKRHCDCRAKCMRCPGRKNVINVCKCRIKHECDCVKVRKPVLCKSFTGDGVDDTRDNGDNDKRDNGNDDERDNVDDNKCNNGDVVVNKVGPSHLSQSVNCDASNVPEVQPAYNSQYSNNESARQTVLHLCIAINEQVCFKVILSFFVSCIIQFVG